MKKKHKNERKVNNTNNFNKILYFKLISFILIFI